MGPLALALLSSSTAAPDLGAFAERFKVAVVHLSIEDARGKAVGNGSGFFVSASGRLVTNHHVVDDASRMHALLADGRKVEILGILADDEKNDLAVLQAEGAGYAPLELAGGQALKVGDEVRVISSPMGLSGTLSHGIVSALRAEGPRIGAPDEEKRQAHWQIQHTADVSPGSSGSPLMTPDGRVVGVVVGLVVGEHLNFAIPVERVTQLLDALPPGAEPRPFGRSVGRNLTISGVAFGAVGIVWLVLRQLNRRSSGKQEPPRRAS